MGVNAWHIIYRLNYPPGRIRWALISTHKQLTQQPIITPPITLLQWVDALGASLPSNEHDDSERRGAAVCSRWTTPWHLAATQESFKDTMNSLVPLKAASSPRPKPSSVYNTSPQRCWLVERPSIVSAGRWSAHASATLSQWDSAASTRISLQLVQKPSEDGGSQEMDVHETHSGLCTCVFVCHCK